MSIQTSNKLEQLNNQLAAANQVVSEAKKELRKAEARMDRAESSCEAIKEQIEIEQLRLWGRSPDLAALLQATSGYYFYKALTSYAEAFGFTVVGQWCDTKQRVLQFSMNRGERGAVARYVAAVRHFAPSVKPIKGGWARFSILHRDMSKCAWELHYSVKRGAAQLVQMSYGTVDDTLDFLSLESALQYIEDNLWKESVFDQELPALSA